MDEFTDGNFRHKTLQISKKIEAGLGQRVRLSDRNFRH
jgi:hypothetical protein